MIYNDILRIVFDGLGLDEKDFTYFDIQYTERKIKEFLNELVQDDYNRECYECDDGYDSGYNDGFEQGYKKGLEQAQDKDRRDFGEESHTKGCGLKTDIIIIDDLISNDGASKETTRVVIDFIKNKNKPKI